MSEPISIKDALAAYTESNHPEFVAALEEINALVNGDSQTNFKAAEARLGEIYDTAQKAGAGDIMRLSSEAYTHTKELWQANDQLLGVAVASKAAMQKAVEEREELVTDITERNEQNPLIFELVEDVQDEATEGVEEAIEEAKQQATYEAITEGQDEAAAEAYRSTARHLMEFLSMEKEAARFWAKLFVRGYGAHFFHEDTLAEIGRVLTEALAVRHGG